MIFALKGIVGVILRVQDVSCLEARRIMELRRDIEADCLDKTGA